MIGAYRRVGNREMAKALDAEWEAAASAVRRQASIDFLERLVLRVRRNRSIAR